MGRRHYRAAHCDRADKLWYASDAMERSSAATRKRVRIEAGIGDVRSDARGFARLGVLHFELGSFENSEAQASGA